jgi:hypothetical protein
MSTRVALQMAAPQAVKPNGVVLYEGPSRHDGRPVVVIATGIDRKSQNPKTGPMIQVWLMRQDVAPAEAVPAGEDASVCNDCPMRAYLRRQDGTDAPACYVRADAAVNYVWKAYRRGNYPRLTRPEARRLLKGRAVRGGAYGNLSNVPLWVSRLWAGNAKRHTQYDHAWRTAPRAFAGLAMASVGSEAERLEAKRLGYRTFRVKQPEDAVAQGEIECPAQDKFRADPSRRHVTCETCGACNGNGGSGRRVDIVIDDHGPTSRVTQAKRRAALTNS